MTNVTFFTLCSSNYLAHARTLGESVRRHHPSARFVIGLVDRIAEGVPEKILSGWELLPVEQLSIPGFADMASRYNIVELNTAVKPFYLEYLYSQSVTVDAVIYLDPDMVLFSPMTRVLERLHTHSLVFTPHSCSADDSALVIDYERAMLSTGVFNLGFLATRRSKDTDRFARWWQRRLFEHCYYRPGTGLFVDQIWANLAPVYFESAFIERDPGHNVAYWNLFERKLARVAGGYVVNGSVPLVFFHFTNYNPQQPEKLAHRAWPRIPTFAERPDLGSLFDEYRESLLYNGYDAVRELPYLLADAKRPEPQPSFVKRITGKALRALPGGVRHLLMRAGHFVYRHCEPGT
jgi:hypothetical protein